MSHWFDRLASWSAAEDDDSAQRLLTRRQVVLASAGAGAAGMLGSPLLSRALAEHSGCDCARAANKQFEKASGELQHDLLDHGNALLSVVTIPVFLVAYSGLVTGTYFGMLNNCGVLGGDCDKVPSGKPPPPKAQPCTQRGGVRLRGDQCGGDGGGATGGSGCAGGTSSCPTPTGGDLCCFGSDICCSGCCCIAEVGCTCCG